MKTTEVGFWQYKFQWRKNRGSLLKLASEIYVKSLQISSFKNHRFWLIKKGFFMTTPQETAYPTLKKQITRHALKRIYTPSALEIAFVKKHSRTPQYRVCMLTLLKCTQRLGYFVFLNEIPRSIPKYIAGCIRCPYIAEMLEKYDNARVRTNHIDKIRSYLNIKPADKIARSEAQKAMKKACPLPKLDHSIESMNRLKTSKTK